MNKKIIFKFTAVFIFLPAALFLLSTVLKAVCLLRDNIFVLAGGQVSAVPAYKSIPLKTILKALEIEIVDDDFVSEDLDKPSGNFHVYIAKVRKERRKVESRTPYRVIWRAKYNSNLRDVELQKGIEKRTVSEFEDIYHDDELYASQIVNEKTLEIEHYRLVLLTPQGKPEQFYDLYKAPRMKMLATAYYPGDPLAWGDGTVTFLGQKMQRGIVAVDPKVIPLRTRLFVAGFGYGYAGDTGNAIIGDRVDLGVNNRAEEGPWTFRNVVVYILEPSKTW